MSRFAHERLGSTSASANAEIVPLYPQDSPSELQDHSRPSLFELLAEEQLRDVLHPVVRYVLSYLAQNYPRYFLRVLNHHEEVFAGLLLLVERHHLKKHNASLSEHFYGLRLAPVQGIPTPRLDQVQGPRPPQGLSRRQRWGMLLILVGLPYLRARAQDYYERLGGGRDGEEDTEPEIRATSRRQRLFKALYPYVNLAFDSTLLGYDLAYLFGHSGDYRPWHKLLGLRIRRRSEDDSAPPTTSLLSRLPPLLPPLLLALKLSQWWYSPTSPRLLTSSSATYAQSTSSAKLHAGILPPRKLPVLPDALSKLSKADEGSGSESDPEEEMELEHGYTEKAELSNKTQVEKAVQIGVNEYGICPICKDKWQNPAVLPSGWVVCWRCGWEAVEGESEDEADDSAGGEEETSSGRKEDAGNRDVGGREAEGRRRLKRRGKCPITGVEVGEGQLRRVLL